MHLPDPSFPPLLTGYSVSAPQTPLDEALAGLAQGRFGAGDVIWSRNTQRCALTCIFEPDVDRARAAEMLPLSVVALGDALGALVPPELPITWCWPAVIRADGARIGEINMLLAPDGEDGLPQYLVIDLWLALRDHGGVEPGDDLENTTLFEEGCADLDRTRLIESFSRHLLTWLHRWNTEGFAPVHEAYLFRADGYKDRIALDHGGEAVRGDFCGLDEHGNLLLRNDEGTRLLKLLDSSAMIDPVQS